jgi:NitT/TauT family transport system permease protein/sulfonate transport system permease protein
MPADGKTGGRGRGQILPRLIGDSLILVAIGLWWLGSRGRPGLVMAGARAVGRALLDLFIDPEQLAHVAMSALRVVASVCIAVVIGTALAMLPRRWPALRLVIHDCIRPVLNSFPSVGWAILAVIWFRVSDWSVIFIEVMILTPFCLINIDEGLKELDAEVTEMGRSFTRSRWRMLTKIVLPLLAPYLVAAVRMSYGVGWKLALVAELFGSTTGLGFLMLQAQTIGNAATVFATCFAIVLLFVLGERLLIDPLARMFKAKA